MTQGSAVVREAWHSAHIDALRGIAALAVIVIHTMAIGGFKLPPLAGLPISRGTLGVPLFYMLSALTLSLSMSRRPAEPLSYFYIRRFFRIAPMFYAMIVVYWFVIGPQPLFTILTNITFVFNVLPSNLGYAGIVWASWSISVEMMFYVIFPLLFLRVAITPYRSLAVFAISVAVALLARKLVAAGLLSSFVADVDPVAFTQYSVFTNLPYFAAGILAFRFVGARQLNERQANAAIYGALLASLIVAYLPSRANSAIPLGFWAIIPFFGFIVGLQSVPVRLIVNRITAHFGRISYSTYLIHAIVIWHLKPIFAALIVQIGQGPAFIVGLAISLSCTTILSEISFRLIELPGINVGSWLISYFSNLRKRELQAGASAV